jgi:tetratricopeptide (TPR) repeat protein
MWQGSPSNIAQILKDKGSLQCLKLAVQVAPNEPDGFSRLGWAQINGPGAYSEGLLNLDRAIQLSGGKDALAYVYRTWSRWHLGRFDRTLDQQDLHRAMELAPDVPTIRDTWANWLWRNSSVQAAIPHLEALTKLAPDNAVNWLQLAAAYTEAHLYCDALRGFQRAARFAPENQQIKEGLQQVRTLLFARGQVCQ